MGKIASSKCSVKNKYENTGKGLSRVPANNSVHIQSLAAMRLITERGKQVESEPQLALQCLRDNWWGESVLS